MNSRPAEGNLAALASVQEMMQGCDRSGAGKCRKVSETLANDVANDPLTTGGGRGVGVEGGGGR